MNKSENNIPTNTPESPITTVERYNKNEGGNKRSFFIFAFVFILAALACYFFWLKPDPESKYAGVWIYSGTEWSDGTFNEPENDCPLYLYPNGTCNNTI